MLANIQVTLMKWKAVLAIYFQDNLAYQASWYIWILTDVVTAVTMPLVWASAASSGEIAGFTSTDFILYYLCMLLVNSFVTSHLMWEIAMEIKEGNFSVQLLRPIGFFSFSFFRNLSMRITRTVLFTPIFLLLLWVYSGWLQGASVYLGWEFWVALLLGHLVSFFFVMAMSMIALFTQEAQSIFELYYVPMLFLSGQLFPIALLPNWAQNASMLFPFYYTTALPVEILVGRMNGATALPMIGLQAAWVVLLFFLAKWFWKKGLQHYTGVGM
jgi:ABC-2 type transport system permease protein